MIYPVRFTAVATIAFLLVAGIEQRAATAQTPLTSGGPVDLELPRFGGRFSAWVTSGYPQAARGAPQTLPSAQPCG
jgi:hypothetical protein